MARTNKELTKEERAAKKYRILKNTFKNLPKEKQKIAEDLIKNAAFMATTLEDLQKEINQNGTTEEYKNGANQTGRKPSSAATIYNKMLPSYNSCIRNLMALLPKESEEEKDGFEDF